MIRFPRVNRRFFMIAPVLAGVLGAASPLAAAAAAVAAAPLPARGLALLMIDRPGCAWCAAFRREILPGYSTHPQGRAAPLSVIPLDGPWPDGLALARRPYLTPSFILLRDRAEVARIEGYPGPRHFWPLFRDMLAKDAALNAAGLNEDKLTGTASARR